MALIVCTFLWGDKYGIEYLERVKAGFARHLKESHRFLCLTDNLGRKSVEGVDYRPIDNRELTETRGCFARLRLFDPYWQFMREIKEGDRIVCVDLDCVVTGPLDVLFSRPEPFLILTGANATNPCPYNGSLWMLRAGYRPDVWTDFSLEAAGKVPHYEFPDDQGWLAHKIPNEPGWKVGPQSGIYAFKKPGWPKGDDLPKDARLVVFPGWRVPAKFARLPWVREHWC